MVSPNYLGLFIQKDKQWCKMKTIGIVANTSWNILNFRKSLIEELQKDFQVVILAPEDEYSEQVKAIAQTYFLQQLLRKGTNPLQEIRLLRELKKAYKQLELDAVIHFTIKPNIYGSIAASKIGIPSIAVVTGLGYTFLSKGIAARVAKKLYKIAFRKNSHTIFQNPDDRQLFIDLRLVKKEKSSVVYGSGIDLEQFYPLPRIDNKNGFHILFVGRMLYDKGVQELLKAFTKSFNNDKTTTLHLVGEIDEGNPSAFSAVELEQILDKNENIIYHGKVSPVNEIIAKADCVVLPSYREGLPRVLLEALAMGKPIITTDVPGCREVVNHGVNGFLVENKSSNSLAGAMMKMRRLSSQELETMGSNGLKMVIEQFSSTVVNRNYVELIKQIL